MINKLMLGQYKDKKTLIHSLDPRTKVFSVMALSTAIFLSQDAYTMFLYSILILLISITAGLEVKHILQSLKPFLTIFLFILIMYVFFTPTRLDFGLLTIWRFILLILVASILTFTTSITGMVTAIEKFLYPLRYLGLSPKTAALLITLTIRFIPLLFMYAQRLKDARVARLGSLKRPKQIKLFFIPLIDKIFKSASTVSDALVSRNYSRERTTYFKPLSLKRMDFFSSFVIVFVISIVIAI
jgi:energy-coupling factor transporter transmembrane protein EcfT